MAHRLAPRAETDLDEIWCYVAKESGSIEIANRLITPSQTVSSCSPVFPTSGVHATKILGSDAAA
jgi:hypothetical protein